MNLTTQLLFATPAAGALALVFAYYKASQISRGEVGTDRMREVAAYIRQGAMAFLKREYRILGYFSLAVAIALLLAYWKSEESHPLVAGAFLLGAAFAGLSGYFGMRVATSANVHTTNAARKGLLPALEIAFAGGSALGMSVVGLGVIGLSGITILLHETALVGSDWNRILSVVSGFALGASSIALFARVGGGIYSKAADVGADLVGKVEAGLPEDDPRNPAVIADNVGDNVGDVAGMGTHLFESYVGSIVGAMVLAAAVNNYEALVFPLVIAGAGIVVSMFSNLFVRTSEGANPKTALELGTFGAAVIMIGVTAALAWLILPDGIQQGIQRGEQHYSWLGVFGAVTAGLVAGSLIGLASAYYTRQGGGPVHQIAQASQTGSATTVIAGLAVGMKSTAIPVILIGVAIIAAFELAGLYGIAMAALGMLSTTGIQLAVDAYRPIADNAGGIAEMSGLDKTVRQKTDELDQVGTTAAAVGKGFAVASAALTAFALFSAYITKAGIERIDVAEPHVLVGLFVGAMLPFVFSSMAMTAVARGAYEMINEVRRQLREIPGLLDGKAPADHARCLDIATAAAIRRMMAPGLLVVLAPVVVGFYDKAALAGLLVGVTVTGVLLAIFQANAGGAWDNAKKHIEAGHFGGKGSGAHEAAVVGDTVGNPFKDTSGPALNIMIKLLSIVALVLAPLLA